MAIIYNHGLWHKKAKESHIFNTHMMPHVRAKKRHESVIFVKHLKLEDTMLRNSHCHPQERISVHRVCLTRILRRMNELNMT